MTRNEAVQKLATVGRLSIAHAEDLYDSIVPKPVVKQYVADWYEENKEDFDYNLWVYLTSWEQQTSTDFKEWICNNNTAFQTLVNMHQFGYEVEKEARYTVRFKGLCDKNIYLTANLFRNFWKIKEDIDGCKGTVHTRKELESNGFGWVFDCDGIEIEEVE